MIQQTELADELARLGLFADLDAPQLEAVAHVFDEQWFEQGARILRQHVSGSGFYVILDGEVAVRLDGQDVATLGTGDFFGEVSALLGEPPVADIVALRPVRCLHLGAPQLHEFLVGHPTVLYRMFLDQTRRLRNADRWRR